MSAPVARLDDGVIRIDANRDYTPFMQSIRARWNPIPRRWELPLTADGLSRTRRIAGVLIDRRIMDELGEEEYLPPDAPAPNGVVMPVNAKPYPHQIAGYARAMEAMRNGGGYGLLFEQGCGKTLTAIGVVGGLCEMTRALRVLVLCPLSVVPVWGKEFERYAAFPNTCTTLLEKPVSKRCDTLKSALSVDTVGAQVFVSNYDSIRTDAFQAALIDAKFDCIILDESQRVKAYNSQISKIVGVLGKTARYRLILTGTPVGNSPLDIWAQFRFLMPNVFNPSFYAFRARYAMVGGFNNHQIIGYNHLDELMQKISAYASRVTKRDALELPEYIDQTLYCEMDEKARRGYDQLKKDSILELEGELRLMAPMVMTKLMRLAQYAGGFVEHDLIHEAKLKLYRETLSDLIGSGHKVVVFCRYIPEVLACTDIAKELGAEPVTIYGDVPGDARGEMCDRFQSDPQCRVFVAQIRTAGLGLTLTAADVAMFYSKDFSLIDYQQARDRIHRVGQTKSCTCIHLVTKDTVDEYINDALDAKRDMAGHVVDSWRDIIR